MANLKQWSRVLIETIIPRQVIRLRGASRLLSHDIGPPERAPRLALVADVEGNELNGMFALTRLAAFLRHIASGKRRGLQLRERVVIVPTVNARRFTRRWGGYRHATGTATDWVMEMTRIAYYRVEVRTANCNLEEVPQVWLYAPSDDERASACLFGLPVIIEQPADDESAGKLMRAWRSVGGENFVIHAGQLGNLQTRHCETLFRALAAFLDHAGIIGGLRSVEDEEDMHYFDRRQVCDVPAEWSGLFSSTLDIGGWIQAGEELGQIYDNFTGEVRGRVIAPVTGLLAGLRRQPLLCEKDMVARILAP